MKTILSLQKNKAVPDFRNLQFYTWKSNSLDVICYENLSVVVSGSGPMENYSPTMPPPWKNMKNNFTEIIIIPGVTTIGDYSFESCSQVVGALIIPDGIITIGIYAFAPNPKMTCGGALVFPDSVTSIGKYAFYLGHCLEGTIKLSNKLTEISDSTFSICTKLTGALEIPPLVTRIGDHSFGGCIGLESVTFPNGLTEIGSNAFSNDEGLKCQLNLPSTLKSIGESAFAQCMRLTGSLILPDQIETIKELTFDRCNSMKGTLTLPKNIAIIEAKAFFYCFGFIGSLEIPNTISYIGDYAFYTCYGFKRISVLSNGAISIGVSCFESCSGLEYLLLPSELFGISNYLCKGCKSLKRLILPDNLHNSVGEDAFFDTPKLCGVIVADESHKSMLVSNGKMNPNAFLKCKASDSFSRDSVRKTSFIFMIFSFLYFGNQ